MNAAGVLFQTVSAQPQLVGGLLARDVQRRDPLVLQARGALHQQRRLADSRLAADERHGAWHDSPAENEVELGEAGAPATLLDGWKVGQLDGNGRSFIPTFRPSNIPPDRLLHQGIPRTATIAAAPPLGLIRPAFRATKDRLAFRHGQPPPATPARCSCRIACTPS